VKVDVGWKHPLPHSVEDALDDLEATKGLAGCYARSGSEWID